MFLSPDAATTGKHRFVTPDTAFPTLAHGLSNSRTALVTEAEIQEMLPVSKLHTLFREGNDGVEK